MQRQVIERSIHGRDRRAHNPNVDKKPTKDKKIQEFIGTNDESKVSILSFEQANIPIFLSIVLLFNSFLFFKPALLITFELILHLRQWKSLSFVTRSFLPRCKLPLNRYLLFLLILQCHRVIQRYSSPSYELKRRLLHCLNRYLQAFIVLLNV